MATLRYLHTFIDEERHDHVMARHASWPQLAERGSFAAGYVAGLEGRCVLNFQRPVVAQAPEVLEVAEAPEVPLVQQEEVEVPFEAGETPELQQTEVQVVPSPGSRAHPFLCNRPCVRFAKGTCESGDACGYCHHLVHPRYVNLDRRQRAQMKEMENGDLVALLLPLLHRSLRAAQIEAPQIIAMLEQVGTTVAAPQVDQGLLRILKQMPLVAILGLITSKLPQNLGISLKAEVEALRGRLVEEMVI